MDKRLDPDASYQIHVKVPGSLKQQIVSHAAKLGVPVGTWIVAVLRSALYHQQGLPEPPRAFAPLPTPAEEIRAYAEGRKVLTPCGKQGSCAGTEQPPVTIGEMGFCRECDIRIV